MRAGVRGKELVAATVLACAIVATASALHLSQLSRVVIQDGQGQADLVARQIHAQTGRALARASGRKPEDALRRDRELRSLLDASVGYSPHLLYAALVDHSGTALLHTEPAMEGRELPARPGLAELAGADPVRRFAALARGGATYEVTLPLRVNDAPFGSIRLGISTTLLRRELMAAVRQNLILTGIALILAWIFALVLTRRLLRPLRALVAEMDRIRRGELDAVVSPSHGDEFQQLSSQVQRLGRELQADRLSALGEQAQLRQVVNRLEDGVVFLNDARTVLFFNQAAERAVGRPLEQAVGSPIDALLGDAHPLRPLVDQVFDGGSGVRDTPVALHGDGGVKDVLVSVFPVYEGPRGAGAVIVLKDLEPVKTVQSLVSYSARLAALGRLTSGVAHEVKNPLNAMMIHVELLREKIGSEPGDGQQSLEILTSEIRRLDRVVQGFLRFMRPQELTPKTVDVNALLHSVVALLEAEWTARGVRFAFDLDRALPTIVADEELLRQAFLNILQNACQAMPAGGTVTVRASDEGGDGVRVCVIDEGVGIPPEEIDRIFKLYYTTKPDGSGIGLSLVYRIVQMHDGAIEVDSAVGRGTTITVWLPVGHTA
jgi:signal transduction histidine kinase